MEELNKKKSNLNYTHSKSDKNVFFDFYEPDKTKYYNNDSNLTIEEENNKIKDNKKFENSSQTNKWSGTSRANIPIFNTQLGTSAFKFRDKQAEELRKERNLNGESEKTAIKTLENFSKEEVAGKTHYLAMLANNEEALEKLETRFKNYISGKTMEKISNGKENFELASKKESKEEKKDKESFEKIKMEKWFYDNYEPLEIIKDEKTAVIASVFGNIKTGELEIFYGGSNMPFKNKNSSKDWGNDITSGFSTSDNYKVALKIAKEVNSKKYKGEKRKEYNTLTGVSGHSKGGGEALYVASNMNLKALIVDPAPVIKPGKYINNNKILALIPGNGEGVLDRAKEIPGTGRNLFTLEQKVGLSEGKGKYKTTILPALPIEGKGNKPFDSHFPLEEDVAEKFEKAQKYTEYIKQKHYEYFKDDVYTKIKRANTTTFNLKKPQSDSTEKKIIKR